MKKSNQKSLGEDPETLLRVGTPRPETLRIPGAGLDDADKEPQAHFNLVPANRLQEVTLSSLWVEQSAICPDGPSPATGEGDGEGADAPAATLGAYLCAVRTMLQHRSYPALQATERGLSRGNLSPLTVFCLLLHEQK